jgi:hypothetical protein
MSDFRLVNLGVVIGVLNPQMHDKIIEFFLKPYIALLFAFKLKSKHFHQLTLKPVYINNPKVNNVYFSR